MSKQKMNVLLGIVALVLGGFIYVAFQENSYVARFCAQLENISYLQKNLNVYSNDFLLYYFPDFLWGFSLCCGLQIIHRPGVRGTLLCSVVAFLCGMLWELLQSGDYVIGTGDVIDVLMYLLASFVSIIINLKEREK